MLDDVIVNIMDTDQNENNGNGENNNNFSNNNVMNMQQTIKTNNIIFVENENEDIKYIEDQDNNIGRQSEVKKVKLSNPQILGDKENKLTSSKIRKITNNNVSSNEMVLFFFINPKSGAGSGQNIMNMKVKKVEFSDTLDITGNRRCTAYIFDLTDELQCNLGINILLEELERGKNIL
jgi:hypothetical protein